MQSTYFTLRILGKSKPLALSSTEAVHIPSALPFLSASIVQRSFETAVATLDLVWRTWHVSHQELIVDRNHAADRLPFHKLADDIISFCSILYSGVLVFYANNLVSQYFSYALVTREFWFSEIRGGCSTFRTDSLDLVRNFSDLCHFVSRLSASLVLNLFFGWAWTTRVTSWIDFTSDGLSRHWLTRLINYSHSWDVFRQFIYYMYVWYIFW